MTCEVEGPVDKLTELGLRIADGYLSRMNVQITFREILEQYIHAMRPGWANRMPVGRRETFASLTKDEMYCFSEAGLASEILNDSLVDWWDGIAAEFRTEREQALLCIGRRGERLTVKYERKRTGVSPKWISVDTNFAGYDILSVECLGSSVPRCIEVKTSERPPDSSEFCVSKNEWDVAVSQSDNYYFYLWLLTREVQLAIISASEVAAHIATNQGRGQWMSVAIPYSAFSSRFIDIDSLS